jgi:hypothetical protein
MFQFGYMVYSLNKVMNKALLDRGKFGGIGGDAMIVTEGSERFGNLSRLASQTAYNIRFIMDPLFISMHKGDVDRISQRIYLIGNASVSCLHMSAYDASIDDGPHNYTVVNQVLLLVFIQGQCNLRLSLHTNDVVHQV